MIMSGYKSKTISMYIHVLLKDRVKVQVQMKTTESHWTLPEANKNSQRLSKLPQSHWNLFEAIETLMKMLKTLENNLVKAIETSWNSGKPTEGQTTLLGSIITVYGPMIYTVQHVMCLMGANPLYKGHWKGWAMKVETFLGRKKSIVHSVVP